MARKVYDQWEQRQEISGVSPEAHYAEKAWNAALDTLVRRLGQRHVLDDPRLTLAINELRTEKR